MLLVTWVVYDEAQIYSITKYKSVIELLAKFTLYTPEHNSIMAIIPTIPKPNMHTMKIPNATSNWTEYSDQSTRLSLSALSRRVSQVEPQKLPSSSWFCFSFLRGRQEKIYDDLKNGETVVRFMFALTESPAG